MLIQSAEIAQARTRYSLFRGISISTTLPSACFFPVFAGGAHGIPSPRGTGAIP